MEKVPVPVGYNPETRAEHSETTASQQAPGIDINMNQASDQSSSQTNNTNNTENTNNTSNINSTNNTNNISSTNHTTNTTNHTTNTNNHTNHNPSTLNHNHNPSNHNHNASNFDHSLFSHPKLKRKSSEPKPRKKSVKPNPKDGANVKHASGHRPVTSCTHCRQHKIKCNASERFPLPCARCDKMALTCEIDPQFRPKKGSQIQCLKNDVDELRSKIEFLTRNEHLLIQLLQLQGGAIPPITSVSPSSAPMSKLPTESPPLVAKTFLKKEPHLLHDVHETSHSSASTPELLNDSLVSGGELPPIFEKHQMRRINSESSSSLFKNSPRSFAHSPAFASGATTSNTDRVKNSNSPLVSRDSPTPSSTNIAEFILGGVKLSLEKATELHRRFVDDYLPFLPILSSDGPTELYQQSQLLFWVVMLTACLSDPEPTLYMSLLSLIKQLAIETCWIRTPRSTHIVQLLLILGTWPLPNQKILDDCSYRFIGLAKNLSFQLGLHRGKFISEFSRTQVALPNAEKWRTRTWLAVFLGEQFWSSTLGLPPSMNTDFLLEKARIDNTLPKSFRCLISLAIFQSKLVNTMGSSVSTPDGLMDPKNRLAALTILERELERLSFKLQIDNLTVEIYYLYVKLMLCCFAFLPDTPVEDQTAYVVSAYTIATRVVTIISKLIERRQLIEYPIYVRQSVTLAVFLLFRLHLSPYLLPKYIDSARQSIVTVHRLFRNMLSSWKDVENDISRTATVLEKLNFVIITHPELFTKNEGIIVRMRSHLTGSLFYDLVWCVHEARRRVLLNEKAGQPTTIISKEKRPLPLPFYNQITKDDFNAITTTTPNGTTVTTLVPTDRAMNTATANATLNGLSGPTEINGIPISMLEATGSTKVLQLDSRAAALASNSSAKANNNTVVYPENAGPLKQESSVPVNWSQVINYNSTVDLQYQNTTTPGAAAAQTPSSLEKSTSDQQFIDTIFQQQGADWMEGGDDFLGWFDMNMAPSF